MSKRVHVIACGVLALDLKAVAAETGLDLSLEFLPGGLHREPRELRRRLQAAIDAASQAGSADLIAIGYGVCGLGTVGIHARQIPLAVPRVHDCIALFLGSDAAYRRQFAACPGTYYISTGWVDEKASPLGASDSEPKNTGPANVDYEELVGRYGRENADAIRYFLSSWQRNYKRAAFIDTGGDAASRRHADIARTMASEFGWKYEELRGTRELLTKLIKERSSTDEILVVPPHHVTAYDALSRGLKAVPVWEQGTGPGEKPGAAEAAPVLPSSFHASDTGALAARRADPAIGGDTVDVGLGIDAGGTYTDVVIYDFRSQSVVQKAKALTTKWDHAIGIEKALAQLSRENLARVRLAAVSTTLATNAIVEGRGQKVGLLLMPPYGCFQPENFSHSPIAVIEGKLEIDGTELAPIDAGQVRQVVRDMIERERVGAFAVTGYASHANPDHELQVKAIVREECALHVTCGHDISEGLNYRIRAETAALNARIMPYLEALLDKVQAALRAHGVESPVMVVRSDGSLMSLDSARQRPIETILSGPAASAAGARHLSGVNDAIVVDVGGTTTDTAMLRGGKVRTCEDGATVGRWKTHVRALDVRTIGLGGDSHIVLERGVFQIGPRRVAPVAWMAANYPSAERTLAWIARHVDAFDVSTKGMDIIALIGTGDGQRMSGVEKKIVDALAAGPLTVVELADRAGVIGWQFLPLEHLETHHVVQRCAATPTDLLHATGQVSLWDSKAARGICDVLCRLTGLGLTELADKLVSQMVRSLAGEILKKQLDEEDGADGVDVEAVATTLVLRAFGDGSDELRVKVAMSRPVIGIGAPVQFFLPAAAAALGTQAVIPTHADVANAVGAITGHVFVHRRVRISVNDAGSYAVEGLPGVPSFANFEEANAFAASELTKLAVAMAREAGTSETAVEILTHDQVGELADGNKLFLGRTVEVRLSGRPDVAR